jgi:formylglycine-generating enzyme required for sulfatase activity
MDFVYIKPGTFLMGIPEGYIGHIGGENPRHKVTITNGFYIQSTEVTQEQWFNVTGYNPSYFNACDNDCPVENVSWDEIQEFTALLNELDKDYEYRLPTEAEWEYAARANSSGPYYFGDCLTTFHANFRQWYFNHETMYKCQNGISIGHPIPVGSLEKNGYGLYDMYGNVAEWCQDYWGERPIQHSHVTDPQGPSKGFGRVVRGGSWESLPVNCLSGYSIGALQKSKNGNTGFRLILRKKR